MPGPQRAKKWDSRLDSNACCSVLVHCYSSFQKPPQKTDQDISVLHCDTEEESILLHGSKGQNSAVRGREEGPKPGRKEECEALGSDTDSDGSDCLVANEAIRVSEGSPGLRRIRK